MINLNLEHDTTIQKRPQKFLLVIIIIMEIYAAPKLSRYMTVLGPYNVKSSTYEINQHTHVRARTHTHTHTPTTHSCAHTHTHTHTHTHIPQTHTRTRARARALTHERTHTQARSKKFVLRKIRQRNKSRRLETLMKEMGFQSLSK